MGHCPWGLTIPEEEPLDAVVVLTRGAVTVRRLLGSLPAPLGLAAGFTEPGRLEMSEPGTPRRGEGWGTGPSDDRLEEESWEKWG